MSENSLYHDFNLVVFITKSPDLVKMFIRLTCVYKIWVYGSFNDSSLQFLPVITIPSQKSKPHNLISTLRSLKFHFIGSNLTGEQRGTCQFIQYLNIVPGSQLLQQRLRLLQELICDIILKKMRKTGKKEKSKVGVLIGHTWKTTSSLWNAKTWGRGRQELRFPDGIWVYWSTYFPQTLGKNMSPVILATFSSSDITVLLNSEK